jgi:hypothetical protein
MWRHGSSAKYGIAHPAAFICWWEWGMVVTLVADCARCLRFFS